MCVCVLRLSDFLLSEVGSVDFLKSSNCLQSSFTVVILCEERNRVLYVQVNQSVPTTDCSSCSINVSLIEHT